SPLSFRGALRRGTCPGGVPFLDEVLPLRVPRFDEGDLLRAAKPLDLLFPRDRVEYVRRRLEIDEPIHPILPRDPGTESFLVFVHPPRDVVRDAGVESLRPVRRDVDPVFVASAHRRSGEARIGLPLPMLVPPSPLSFRGAQRRGTSPWGATGEG